MEDHIILPRLQPARALESGDVLCRPLLGEDPGPEAGIPWVCFAQVDAGQESLLSGALASDTSLAEIEEQARDNLLTVQVEWDVRSAEDSDRPVAMLGYHDFAAECILSPPHLIEIQEFLNVERLAVAIPTSGIIAIQDADPPDIDDLLGLLQWAQYVYQDAGEQGLTQQVFLVQDGTLKAVIQADGEADLEDEAVEG